MIKFKDGMTCPACIRGKLVWTIRDLPWQFRIFPDRRRTVFKDAEIYECDICDESFLDPKTNERIKVWIKECKKNESNYKRV